MLRVKLYKYLVFLLIVIGSIFRLTVFAASPPNNSYDDHLEVVNLYAQDLSRPEPFQCWECYQPPLFYYLAATVYRFTGNFALDAEFRWKMVQAINVILSILNLIIAVRIMQLLEVNMQFIALTISFLVVLPRDIFTAAMIGNDYLLVFFSLLAFYFYLRSLDPIGSYLRTLTWFVLLLIVTVLGSLSKQHGLLLYLFPIMVLVRLATSSNKSVLYLGVLFFIVGISISLFEEYWKFEKTGYWFVSNQHFFDYAKDQYPGAIDKVEFSTLRITELFKNPFLSNETSASFFTELFARNIFDYEWRFFSPKIAGSNALGRLGYSLEIIWGLFYIALLILNLKKYFIGEKRFKIRLASIVPILLLLLFLIVPVIQTVRYPYFSSMKSMFMLPGIMILFIVSSKLMRNDSSFLKLWPFLVIINLVYASLLVVHICNNLAISINHLSGPLWPLPG